MARETREQKQERLAREMAKQDADRTEFLKTVPARLSAARDLALNLGVTSSLALTPTGPVVSFRHDGKDCYIDADLTYECEEWELAGVENDLNSIRQAIEARAQRHQLAKDTFASLTQEQKAAVKEFIHSLQ